MNIGRFFKSLKWSNVLFGVVLFLLGCVLPGIGDFLVGENGIVTKIRVGIQNKFFKKAQ